MVKILVIDEKEMRAIIDMYDVSCVEGTDTKQQADLVERIEGRLLHDR